MKSPENKKSCTYALFYILIVLSVTLYVYFLYVTFRTTFSGMLTGGFVVYALFFLPVFIMPLLLLQLYRKWGRFYVLYLLLSCFFLFVFFIFIKTISFREKYRYFDPFLQIQPALSKSLYTPKTGNEVRILFLGGSTTRCATLPESERFSELLYGKLLKHYPDIKITVFNAGMDWFTTRHSLTAYTQYYKIFDADIVIMMHAINDVVRSFTPLGLASDVYKYDYSHFYGPSAHAAIPEKAYAEKLIEQADNFYHKNILGITDITVDYDMSAYKSAKSFNYYYTLLLREVRIDGSWAIVMSEPFLYKNNMSESEKSGLWFSKTFCYNQSENNYKPYGRHLASVNSLKDAMHWFNQISKNIAEKEGALFIDVEAMIKKDSLHFTDDVHYTAKASEEVADILFNVLKENKLLNGK